MPPTTKKPEIVVGLVAAAGTNLSAASNAVKAALAPYGYRTEPIKLSALMAGPYRRQVPSRPEAGGPGAAYLSVEEDLFAERGEVLDRVDLGEGAADGAT